MELILARHGNTFETGENPTWVGCNNDLPLTKEGIEQAKNLALFLKRTNVTLNAVYCGPLQRTLVYAKTIINELQINSQPIVDLRLNEIDYGKWSGLTSAQIQEQLGREELEAWEKYSKWPTESGWKSSEAIVTAEIKSFAEDLIKKYQSDAKILAISSNGRLRYFLKLISNEFETRVKNQNLKIATGNFCKINYNNNQWHLEFWNVKPDNFL